MQSSIIHSARVRRAVLFLAAVVTLAYLALGHAVPHSGHRVLSVAVPVGLLFLLALEIAFMQQPALERLKRILRALPNGVLLVARDGTIERVMEPLDEQMIGDKLRPGAKLDALFSMEEGRLVSDCLEAALATGKVVTLEVDFLAEGGLRHFELRMVRANPNQVYCIVRDVSDQRGHEKRLEESIERLRSLSEASPVAVFQVDANGCFVYANERLAQTAGVSVSVGVSVRDFLAQIVHPLDSQSLLDQWEQMLTTGVGIEASEFRVSRPDNSIGWLRLRTAPIRSGEGTVTGFSGTLADFTAARLGIERRLQRETQMRAIIASAPIVLFSVDLNGIITLIESGPDHFLGFDPTPNVGKHVRDAGVTEEVEAALARTFQGEHVKFQVRQGDNYLDVNLMPMRADDESVIGALGVAVDVTELIRTRDALAAHTRELELLLEKLSNSERDLQAKSQLLEQALAVERETARRDSLTGALNHGAISAMLQALNADIGRPCAVLMVDLDNLKAINSTFSHEAGDLVLQEVCKVLQEEGAIVGRYGGDEFIAILPDVDREAASEYRRRVLARFEEVRVLDPVTRNRVPISAAIGIAAYPLDAESVMDAVRVADVAVLDVKRSKPPPALSGLIVEPSLDDERAARIVGELVPLLTRTGRMHDKLRLAAHRLAIAAGYDVVTMEVLDPTATSESIIESFARVPRSVIEAWEGKLRQLDTRPLFELLRGTHRPVIIDRVVDDERMPVELRRLVFEAGINSTLTVPMLWEDQIMGTISVGSGREAAFSPRDAHFLTSVAAQVTAIVRMAHMVDELQKASVLMADMRGETVMLLARAAEAHSDAAGGVLENVRAVTEALARELGESAAFAGELGLAAVLHDIGKIRIPSTILSKADELSTEDWGLLRMHTIWGQEFFEGRAGFELAATIARSHHERWDGSGYPDGLKGEQIPVPATIVTVADSLDAMINHRPYRQGRSLEEAIQELKRCSGSQFNPDVIRALLRLQRQGQLPLIVTNRGLAA